MYEQVRIDQKFLSDTKKLQNREGFSKIVQII